MIAKISGGKDTGGLIRYLFDTKKAKDHTDPHLVASWDSYAPDPGRTDDADTTRKLLVADLDLYVKQARRLGSAPEKHVWHCSIRASPQDRRLSDEEWADIARRVVAATGNRARRRPGRLPVGRRTPRSRSHPYRRHQGPA